MKKLLPILAAALLLLGLCSAACADEVTYEIESIDELYSSLAECYDNRTETFNIYSSAPLFTELMENNFALVHRASLLSGMSDYSLSYNTDKSRLTYKDITYSDDFYSAICDTADDVATDIASMLSEGAQTFSLGLTQELYTQLFTDKGLYSVMAQQGKTNINFSGYTAYSLIRVKSFEDFSVPYAVAEDVDSAAEFISDWKAENKDAFIIVFDKAVYDTLTRDDWRLIEFLGGIDDFKMTYYDSFAYLYYTGVTYYDTPGAYCTTQEEFKTAIADLSATNTAFRVKTSPDLYELAAADSFNLFYTLTGEAGISSLSLSFSDSSSTFYVSDVVNPFRDGALSSLDQVIAYLNACVERGDSDISLLMTAELYDDLLDGHNHLVNFDHTCKLYNLQYNAGISGCENRNYKDASHAVNLKGIKYYPGVNIIRAIRNGTTGDLTAREAKTMNAALELAAVCLRSNERDTALAIHDALCERIVYTLDDSIDEDDTCIGALLNGEANCDGYADAFYLIGTLDGLTIRYQYGDSRDDGFFSKPFSTHMWNLILLNGTWRLVDVTWDDRENGIDYNWFDIGEERASLGHVWDRSVTVPLLPVTDPATRPVAEYFAATTDEITAAARSAENAGIRIFDIYLSRKDSITHEQLIDALRSGLKSGFRYLWHESIDCMHIELKND